ncbi:hypothetical protein M9458_015496, partial [Cirrhinus mrigala]
HINGKWSMPELKPEITVDSKKSSRASSPAIKTDTPTPEMSCNNTPCTSKPATPSPPDKIEKGLKEVEKDECESLTEPEREREKEKAKEGKEGESVESTEQGE